MIKIYRDSIQGRRVSNEDTDFIYTHPRNHFIAWGIFDGHGGKTISNALKDLIPAYIKKCLNLSILSSQPEFKKTVTAMYNIIQKELINRYPKASSSCGSTANVCIYFKDPIDSFYRLITINLGDTRTIKCHTSGKVTYSTKDHKPENPSEHRRIQSLGGAISWDGSDWRIKGLSLSRAFGDEDSKPYISHIPDVVYTVIKQGDIIVTACDGLWDVLSIEDVKQIVTSNPPENTAKLLTSTAYKKGSYDNISVITVFIN
jgi:serine/threonine protein phosphatase PrpC